MHPQENFFYSNLFVAIITFVVGTFGLYLYHLRKQDEKRRLAKIILLEIENAQEKLQEAKVEATNPDDPLPEHLYTMPTDSWGSNKHYFVEDFKPTEWNSINEFYDLCQLFDEAIRHNDARFAQQEAELRRNVHKATYKYAIECSEKLLQAVTSQQHDDAVNTFFARRDNAIEMLTTGKYIHIYTPLKQNQIVRSCLDRVNTTLSLGIVGQKLDKLSKNRRKLFGII